MSDETKKRKSISAVPGAPFSAALQLALLGLFTRLAACSPGFPCWHRPSHSEPLPMCRSKIKTGKSGKRTQALPKPMIARSKHAPLHLAAIAICYVTAWTVAFVFVNGPEFAFYFNYLGYFWKGGGGERPFFTGLFSIALTVPLSVTAIWFLHRGFKKRQYNSNRA